MFLSTQGLWYGESEFQSPGTILSFTLVFFSLSLRLFVRLSFFPVFLWVPRFKSSFLKWIQIFILRMCAAASNRNLFKLLKSLSGQQVATQRLVGSSSLPRGRTRPLEGENITFRRICFPFELLYTFDLSEKFALSKKSQLFWICMTFLCKLCTYPRF